MLTLPLARRTGEEATHVQMTRPGTLAGIFVLCALGAWLAVRVTFTGLPLLPIGRRSRSLAALALAEAVVGRNVRGRLPGVSPASRSPRSRWPGWWPWPRRARPPRRAIGGLLAGYLVYVLGQLDKTIPARDARVAGVTLGCAVALVAAALYLERCCQAPKPPEDDDEDRPYQRQLDLAPITPACPAARGRAGLGRMLRRGQDRIGGRTR